MDADELAQVIGEVSGPEVSVEGDLVITRVAAIGDAVKLSAADVLDYEYLITPTGVPGIELLVRRGHEKLPVIIIGDDVVFMPVYAADLVVEDAPLRVPSVPNLIAYSEMHRDVRSLGRAIDDPELDLDPETLAATLLAHRCYLSGAVRAGLWPVRVAAWWEYMWARVGRGLPAEPFRADPVWDRLMADVTRARRQAPVR